MEQEGECTKVVYIHTESDSVYGLNEGGKVLPGKDVDCSGTFVGYYVDSNICDVVHDTNSIITCINFVNYLDFAKMRHFCQYLN